MKNHDDKTKRTRIVYVSIFFLLVTGIAATGYVSYRNFERDFRRQAERQISAIAELKVKELMNWRKERLDDAEFLYHNPAFSALVERYFETPNDNEARAQLQAWLDDYQVYHQYDSVRLMDVTGTERLSISTPDLPDSHLTQDAIACLHSGEIAFSDFYRDTGVGDPIHLAVLVPIFADKNNNRPLGVLALGINPQTYLYPYIQSWPIPSDTAETLLVRREGEDVLFLNELRFEQDAALNLRLSLTNTDIPAVKAALGQIGVAEGMDYRGKPVLADVRAVPDSPWFLVSKMDTAEIYLPLRARLWQTLLISGMAIFVAGAGLMLILRQQRLLFYRMQAEKAEALHESEEKFKYVFDYSVVGKSITYLNGEIHVNKALCDMLGYSPQEMQDKKWQEITHPDDIELTQSNIDEIISGKKESARFVKRFIHKNGSIVWVDLSSTIRRDQHNQVLYLMSTLMDITERKQVEEAHAKSEAMLKKVQEVTHMGSWAIDLNTKAVIASDEAHRIYGISQGLMTLDYIQSVPLPEFRPILDAALTALITEGKRYDVEFKIRRRSNGEVRDIHSIAEYNAQSQTIIGSVQDITDRKQAEEALKKSEIWFKSLFEKASDGIFYLSMDHEIVEVNDAFARMHGYRTEEMRKMKLNDLDTPETIRQFPERMRQVMGGEVFKFEVEHYHKDGHVIPLEVTTSMITVGDESYILAFHRDITQRKQAEAALRESEALYRQAIEVANAVPYHQAYHVNGKSVDYDFIGEGIFQITGYKPEEFNEALWDTLIQESVLLDDLVGYSWLEAIERVRSGVSPVWKCNHRIRARDGKIRWVFEAAVELRDENGVSHGSIGMFQDITERKQAEDALRESESALKQAQRVAHVGSWLWDIQANRLEWSDEMYRIFGYKKENFSGRLDEVMAQAIHPDDRAEVEKLNISVIREKKPIPMEYRVVRPDKTIRIVWAEAGQFILDKQGNPAILTGIVQDITERKQAEEEIRKLNAELEQRVIERTAQLENTNKELEAFSYSVSHDLRAPLRGIDGWSQALLEDYHDRLDEQGRQYIDRVRSEAQRMGHLIDDMLKLSRLTRAEMIKEQVDLSALVQTIAERLQTADPQRKVDFIIQAGLTAEGDFYLLEIMLTNLLGNAFKFTAKREKAVIEFGQTESEDQLVFFVRDNGAGFDMTYSRKLFGAFQRMHKASEFPGTGIGLATVQRIIHRHGGHVWAEAEVDRGATFYFTLG